MAAFGSFTAGQVLTAAELNAAGTWQDYTPTWTQSVAITKTVNWARYMQFNKLVQVQLKMTATSAGTASNKILIGLPVSASSNNFLMGTAIRQVNTTFTNSMRFVVYESATTVKMTIGTNINPTAGWHGESGEGITIASGDIYYLNLMYEAA